MGGGGGNWYAEIGLPGSMSSETTLLRFSAGPEELIEAGARWGGGDLFRQYSARPDLKKQGYISKCSFFYSFFSFLRLSAQVKPLAAEAQDTRHQGSEVQSQDCNMEPGNLFHVEPGPVRQASGHLQDQEGL